MGIYFGRSNEGKYSLARTNEQGVFEIGSWADFKKNIRELNKKRYPTTYRLTAVENGEGSFWLFEEDLNEDEVNCAIVKVSRDRVYAISADVYYFLKKVFKNLT